MALIARIKNNVVVNIEEATYEWVTENQGVDGFFFVVAEDENNMPSLWKTYDPITGIFEQGPTISNRV